MLTSILLIILLVLLYRLWFDNSFDIFEKIMFSILEIAIVGLVTFLIIGISSTLINPVEIKRDNCTCLIYSLRNEQGISGHFVLGSGYISSTEYYYMFSKNNDGGFERVQLKADDCIIYQNENNNPRIDFQKVTYRLPRWIHAWPDLEKFHWQEDSKYSLKVPQDTIIQEFKVK